MSNRQFGYTLAVILMLGHVCPLPATAQTPSTSQQAEVIKVSWQDFIGDYKPDMARGAFGMMGTYTVMKKYLQKQVEWIGTFRKTFGAETKVQALIGMPPVSVELPPPTNEGVMDFIFGAIERSPNDAWTTLKPGDQIRFRATLGAVMLLLDSEQLSELEALSGRKGKIPVASITKIELIGKVSARKPAK